jgi:20S proteasome alpha/beta subunit
MTRHIRSTTVLCVRLEREVAMASDGQVTMGTTVMKSNARKLRRMANDRVLAGFAGSTADALALFDKFEAARRVPHLVARPLSWLKIGARIACCGGSKRCSRRRIRPARS